MILIPTLRNVIDNPVLTHELRARMRGPRAYWILLAYMAVVTMPVASFVLATLFGSNQDLGRNPGPQLFEMILIAQAVLIALIAPAVTCGAISLERERHTYEMLVNTRMKASTLVAGKLMASLSFVLLCLSTSLPLTLVTAAFGGLSPADVVGAYLMLALEAGVLGAAGLFWSVIARTTVTATALAYPFVALTGIVTALGAAVSHSSSRHADRAEAGGAVVIGFLSPLSDWFARSNGIPFYGIHLPFWLPSLILAPAIILLFCSLAADRLDLFSPPRRSYAIPSATALILLAVLLLSGGFYPISQGEMFEPWLMDSASFLWSSVFVILGAATPFVATLQDYRLRTPLAALRSSVAGMTAAAAWFLLASAIVAVSLLAENSLITHATVSATSHPAGSLFNAHLNDPLLILPSLGLIFSFLLLETALALAVARATHHRSTAFATTLVMAVLIGVSPLFIASHYPGPNWWASTYLVPLHLNGPYHWHTTLAQIYCTAALLLFILSLIPNWARRKG